MIENENGTGPAHVKVHAIEVIDEQGGMGECPECRRQRCRRDYAANPEHFREKTRRWRQRSKSSRT